MGARTPAVLTYLGRALGKRCLALQLPKHKETHIPHTWKLPAPKESLCKSPTVLRANYPVPTALSFCFKWGVELILVWDFQLELPEALKNTKR